MDTASIVILSGRRDRSRLWLGRTVERLLPDERHAWLAGGGRRSPDPHLCAGDRRGRRRHAIAGGGRPRRHRQVDLSAAIVLGAGDVLRRPVVRLRHGAVERLRVARAGVARARQSPFLRGGRGAGDLRADDAEGPDRAAAHCDGRRVADHGNGKLGAGVARRRGPERNGRAHAGGLDHRCGADHLRLCRIRRSGVRRARSPRAS